MARGITLGSCVAKVFTRMPTRQLGEYAEEKNTTRGTRWISSTEKLFRPDTDTEGSLLTEKKEEKRNIPGLS